MAHHEGIVQYGRIKIQFSVFSCGSGIADMITFLIFLLDVEKHTAFQNCIHEDVEMTQTEDPREYLRNLRNLLSK